MPRDVSIQTLAFTQGPCTPYAHTPKCCSRILWGRWALHAPLKGDVHAPWGHCAHPTRALGTSRKHGCSACPMLHALHEFHSTCKVFVMGYNLPRSVQGWQRDLRKNYTPSIYKIEKGRTYKKKERTSDARTIRQRKNREVFRCKKSFMLGLSMEYSKNAPLLS